jgi:hypothetical protein
VLKDGFFLVADLFDEDKEKACQSFCISSTSKSQKKKTYIRDGEIGRQWLKSKRIHLSGRGPTTLRLLAHNRSFFLVCTKAFGSISFTSCCLFILHAIAFGFEFYVALLMLQSSPFFNIRHAQSSGEILEFLAISNANRDFVLKHLERIKIRTLRQKESLEAVKQMHSFVKVEKAVDPDKKGIQADSVMMTALLECLRNHFNHARLVFEVILDMCLVLLKGISGGWTGRITSTLGQKAKDSRSPIS